MKLKLETLKVLDRLTGYYQVMTNENSWTDYLDSQFETELVNQELENLIEHTYCAIKERTTFTVTVNPNSIITRHYVYHQLQGDHGTSTVWVMPGLPEWFGLSESECILHALERYSNVF